MQKLTNDLEVLAGLRERGDLTDDEFARAKAALLAGIPAAAPPVIYTHPSAALETLARQNEIALLDSQWAAEREKYVVVGKYGAQHTPTPEEAIILKTCAAGFGFLGVGFAISMASWIFAIVVLAIASICFVYATGMGRIARRYREAQARYERRRAALLSGDGTMR